jgi:exosortase
MSTTATPESPAHVRVRTGSALALAVAAAVGIAFAFAFRDVMAGLVSQWEANDAFSHGWLIAPMSAYIAWSRRDRVARAGVRPALVGGTLGVVVSVLALQVGRVIGVLGIQQLAMLLAVASLVVLLLGWRALRALWFPVLYLLFMMPVWDVVTERLHFPFQLLSAQLGTGFLRLFGIPAYLEVNFIHIPGITLEVARVCSGVNYLVAILALAVPLAYLTLRSHARKLALLAFGIAAGFFFNALRVALIGFFSYHQLSEYTHGPWHIFQGLSAALVGYVAIFAFWGVLHRRERAAPPPASPSVLPTSTRPVVLVAATCVAILAMLWASRPILLDASGAEASVGLPSQLSAFQLTTEQADLPRLLPSTTPRDHLRVYRAADGKRLVVLATPLLPAVLVPGGRPGYWSDGLEADANVVNLPGGQGPVGIVHSGRTTTGTASFWYQLGRRDTVRRHVAKLWSAFTTLTGRRPPLVVVVVSEISDEAEALKAFGDVRPALREALSGD